jgi:hypothetical protein
MIFNLAEIPGRSLFSHQRSWLNGIYSIIGRNIKVYPKKRDISGNYLFIRPGKGREAIVFIKIQQHNKT